MRLTTVMTIGASVWLLLFVACHKNTPMYCGEGIEGNYEAEKTSSNIHLEITTGTAPQEKIILIQHQHPTHGLTSSAAVVGYWEESQQTLSIPTQDYGSVDKQITGQLQWHQGQLQGTLKTIQQNQIITIQHQKL